MNRAGADLLNIEEDTCISKVAGSAGRITGKNERRAHLTQGRWGHDSRRRRHRSRRQQADEQSVDQGGGAVVDQGGVGRRSSAPCGSGLWSSRGAAPEMRRRQAA